MTRVLQHISNWKLILPLFILFALFTFYIFPEYQERINNLAGETIQPLDTRLSYSTEEVKLLFDKLTEEGRNIYLFITGKIDMIYPLIYGLLFTLLLANLLKKLTRPGSKIILVSLLPLVGMLFDYLENVNIIRLLNSYPTLSEEHVQWGEQVTRLKHGVLFFSVILILVLAVVLAVRNLLLRRNRQQKNRGI